MSCSESLKGISALLAPSTFKFWHFGLSPEQI
uniref:Uncharacterized protein n=1 Tax=Rhizophora mucronata TaxID=61149 RepID=A0A2P2QA86_RHIMU